MTGTRALDVDGYSSAVLIICVPVIVVTDCWLLLSVTGGLGGEEWRDEIPLEYIYMYIHVVYMLLLCNRSELFYLYSAFPSPLSLKMAGNVKPPSLSMCLINIKYI